VGGQEIYLGEVYPQGPRQCGFAIGSGEDADEGDTDLDGSQEAGRLCSQVECCPSAPVAGVSGLPKSCLSGGDNGSL